MTNQFLGLMLDPFVDGRSGVAGAGGPALGFAPEREALPDDIALAYAVGAQGAAGEGAELRAALERVGRRLWRQQSHRRAIRRWSAATISPPRTAGFAGGLDYRLTPNTRGGLRARRRRHQLEPGAGARRRQERCLPGRRLRRDAFGPGLSRGGLRLHQSLDVDRPLRLRRRSSHRQLQRAELRRAGRKRLSLRHRLRRAHALRRDPGAELPHAELQRDRRQRRRLRARLQRPHRRPTPAASSAPASIACWRSIPTRCWRCARGSPGRTTG